MEHWWLNGIAKTSDSPVAEPLAVDFEAMVGGDAPASDTIGGAQACHFVEICYLTVLQDKDWIALALGETEGWHVSVGHHPDIARRVGCHPVFITDTRGAPFGGFLPAVGHQPSGGCPSHTDYFAIGLASIIGEAANVASRCLKHLSRRGLWRVNVAGLERHVIADYGVHAFRDNDAVITADGRLLYQILLTNPQHRNGMESLRSGIGWVYVGDFKQ